MLFVYIRFALHKSSNCLAREVFDCPGGMLASAESTWRVCIATECVAICVLYHRVSLMLCSKDEWQRCNLRITF